MPVHDLLRESVSLTLVKGVEHVDRKELVKCIAAIVPVHDIDSIGNLGDMLQWYVILKTQLSREKLIAIGELKVGDQVFLVGEPFKQVKLIRMLNIPPSVSDDEIRDAASNWGGTILSVEPERLPQPYDMIKTFVRRVRMKFNTKKDEERVPISIRLNGLSIPVQLEGRMKVCYRCKQAGHIKAECTIVKCGKCYQLGHDDNSCSGKQSYASIVATSTPTITRDDDHHAPEENNTVGAHMINTPSSAQVQKKKKLICRRCKLPGHIRKECPTQPREEGDRLDDTPDNSTGQNKDTPVYVEKDVEFTGVDQATNCGKEDSESPRLEAEVAQDFLENFQQARAACKHVDLGVSNGMKNATSTTTWPTNMKDLYETYKSQNNYDLKRSHDNIGNQSMESENGTDVKKPHLHDSSSTTMGDDENVNDVEEGEWKQC